MLNMDWQVADGNYISGNGGSLNTPQGTGVLFAHSYLNIGASENQEFIELFHKDMVSYATPLDPTILRIVFPGHNSSSFTNLEKKTLQDFINHFAKSADMLRRICKGGVFLVGQSLGALLCLDYYLKNSESSAEKGLAPIKGMCLISTPIVPLLSKESRPNPKIMRYYNFRSDKFLDSVRDLAIVMLARHVQYFNFAPSKQLFEIWDFADSLRERLKAHVVPSSVRVMIMHSRWDRLVFPPAKEVPIEHPDYYGDETHRLSAYLKAQNLYRVVYSKESHLLTADKDARGTVAATLVLLLNGEGFKRS